MKELIEVQNKLKAPKNQFSNFGKYHYRSCEDILEALKPILKENKLTLTITDQVKEIGGIIYVESTATVINEKGSEAYSTAQAGINPDKKGFDIAQSFGAASSYARKYALNGLFLIDDTKDADHDSHKEEPKQKSKPLFTSKIAQEAAKMNVSVDDLDKKYVITTEQKQKYINLVENLNK